MFTSGASFWIVAPPIVKVPAGISFRIISVGSTAFISLNISLSPLISFSEQERMVNIIMNLKSCMQNEFRDFSLSKCQTCNIKPLRTHKIQYFGGQRVISSEARPEKGASQALNLMNVLHFPAPRPWIWWMSQPFASPGTKFDDSSTLFLKKSHQVGPPSSNLEQCSQPTDHPTVFEETMFATTFRTPEKWVHRCSCPGQGIPTTKEPIWDPSFPCMKRPLFEKHELAL